MAKRYWSLAQARSDAVGSRGLRPWVLMCAGSRPMRPNPIYNVPLSPLIAMASP